MCKFIMHVFLSLNLLFSIVFGIISIIVSFQANDSNPPTRNTYYCMCLIYACLSAVILLTTICGIVTVVYESLTLLFVVYYKQSYSAKSQLFVINAALNKPPVANRPAKIRWYQAVYSRRHLRRSRVDCRNDLEDSQLKLRRIMLVMGVYFLLWLMQFSFVIVYTLTVPANSNSSIQKSQKVYHQHILHKLYWDSLHTQCHCCGWNGPTDWTGPLPSSCCKRDKQQGNETLLDERCDKHLYIKGCHEKVTKKCKEHPMFYTLVGFLTVQIFPIASGICYWLMSYQNKLLEL